MNLAFLWACALSVQGPGVEGLISPSAEKRRAASTALARRPAGPWVDAALERGVALPLEGRKLLVSALGRNRDVLARLAAVLSSGTAGANLARAALERHFSEHALPPPASPDSVAVLDGRLMRLDGVRSVFDLLERLLVGGWLHLPLVVDPRLARERDLTARPLDLPEGAWRLRQLLPPPRALMGGPITLITRHGLIVTSPGRAGTFPELFAASLVSFLTEGAPPLEARRAALNLGTLDLPTLLPWLDAKARADDWLGERARVALAAAWIRGWEPRRPREMAPRFWRSFRRGRHRFILGSALRLILTRELQAGRVPDWLKPSLGNQRVLAADLCALLATIPPGPLQARLRATLRGEDAPPAVLEGAALSLAHAPGRLEASLARDITGWVLAGRWTDDAVGNRVLGAMLRLLRLRGGSWIDDVATLSAQARGKGLRRGGLWGLTLGAAGPRGRAVALRTLAAAQDLEPSLLAMTSAARDAGSAAGPLSVEAWLRAGVNLPPQSTGRFLLDLCLGEMGPLPARTLTQKQAWRAAFRRLRRRLDDVPGGDEPLQRALHRALGRSLASALLTFELPEEERSTAQWLVEWLLRPRQRQVFLAAAARAIEERPLIVRDIVLEMRRRRKELASQPETLITRRLDQMVRARPARNGIVPVDPDDPLLAERPSKR